MGADGRGRRPASRPALRAAPAAGIAGEPLRAKRSPERLEPRPPRIVTATSSPLGLAGRVRACARSSVTSPSAAARSRRSPTTRSCRTARPCALVAPSGNVEWMCLPRMDAPSVFGAILDRDAGGFRLGPVDTHGARRPALPARARWSWRRRWGTRTGWIIVRDVLLIGPWHHDDERSNTHRRAPTDYDADHVLLRTVRCVNGDVQMDMDCEPVFDYGRKAGALGVRRDRLRRRPSRAPTASRRRAAADDRPAPRLRGRPRPRALRPCATATPRSSRCRGASTRRRATYDEAYHRLVWTAHHWHHWLSHGEFPDHPWRTYLQRSALTLKGLTYAPTGAMIAAATTSLPETPGGERNWDYRYTWIRDSTFMLWGLYTLGFDWEANDFFYFIADVAARRGRPADHVRHRRRAGRSTEETLDHLDGYEGARPVRIGNGAYAQNQHDVWGAMLDSVYLHTRSRDGLAERLWPILARQVERRDRALARARPRHLGGARRAAALHVVEGHVLGGVRPRRAARAPARGRRARRALAGGRRRDPRRHLRERRRRARRLHPALRHRRARRLAAC